MVHNRTGGAFDQGTLFKLAPDGMETIVHHFNDGSMPLGGVIRDRAGNLYGTTFWGGSSGLGTVFKLDTAGTFTILHSFSGGSDGNGPYAGVIMDNAGNLYGTTTTGGDSLCYCGVVFQITP